MEEKNVDNKDIKERPELSVVFVGHVDHGKSTLIGRLLFDTKSLPEEKISEVKNICEQQGRPFEFAFLMDHMQEERDQNITIDTAQIFFKTKIRDYVIIDAPGHVEFTKNMITGASQAEAAILIVDVGEGMKEQSKRHAKFLSLLGLKQVVVVVNKMDTVKFKEKKFDKVKKETANFLEKIGIEASYTIPISAMEGHNITSKSDKMDWYEDKTVLEALDTFKERDLQTEKLFRMPIQDVYKFNDKRIAVGQIASGKLEVGDELIFLPKENKSKVKSIEKFEESTKKAEAGENIGFTLEDPIFLERGQVACNIDNDVDTTSNIVGNIFWMDKKELNMSDQLYLQCSTQETAITIKKISDKTNSSSLEVVEAESTNMKETEIASVSIETDNPIVVENFNDIPELGRFVLLRDGNVVAGGIITSK